MIYEQIQFSREYIYLFLRQLSYDSVMNGACEWASHGNVGVLLFLKKFKYELYVQYDVELLSLSFSSLRIIGFSIFFHRNSANEMSTTFTVFDGYNVDVCIKIKCIFHFYEASYYGNMISRLRIWTASKRNENIKSYLATNIVSP